MIGMVLLFSVASMAQKFALVDMEYILKNIPAYEMTNEQLSQLSKKWQNEVEAIQQEAQNMYKKYQSDLVFLSAEMKTKPEEEIVKKEQAAQDLKRKYFGAEGHRSCLGRQHDLRLATDRHQQRGAHQTRLREVERNDEKPKARRRTPHLDQPSPLAFRISLLPPSLPPAFE